MHDAVTVRAATHDDVGPLLGLLAQLGGVEQRPDALAARGVLDAVLGTPGRSLLVAEHDGRIVGTLDLVVVPSLAHGGRPWATIENVVVDEPVRNRGVGRALLGRALDLAVAAHCYKVQLLSRADREEAHRFYLRAGFEASAVGFRRYLD